MLKKSFFADDLKFSGLLARLSRCELRDHINCRKNDRWPSYRFYRTSQRLKLPMRYICESFGSPRFSSFSTWGNSGIEPDKGKGISSPGTYEAGFMWPRNDGERQWSTMSDWTCR